jgi:glycosyltransferase involved in cell wall biosynthesis
VRELKILIWHVHGNYLYYLSQAPHIFYVPFKKERSGAYIGRTGTLPWPDNLKEVPSDEVRYLDLDCIVFQRPDRYTTEQYSICTESQRQLPRIYLEHDPPQEHPTNTRHIVDDPNMLLVHVTPFNALMWDSGRTPTKIIDHGVLVPDDAAYQGDKERGLAVVNNIHKRGRRLGADVLRRVQQEVPVDLAGMGAEEVGGLGEISHRELPYFQSRYRFFFNPIRYTSLGLAVCEAMMIGMPVIGLATTEMAVAVQNGISGYTATDIPALVKHMHTLLSDRSLACRLGEAAREYARKRFNIHRFVDDWNDAFALVTGSSKRTSAVFTALGNGAEGGNP